MKNLFSKLGKLTALLFLTISSYAGGINGDSTPCLGVSTTYTVQSQYVCSNTTWSVYGGVINSSSNTSISITWTNYNASLEASAGCTYNGNPIILDKAISPENCSSPSCNISVSYSSPDCRRITNICDESRCIKFKVIFTDGTSHTQTVTISANGNYYYCNSNKTISSITPKYC